MVYISFHRQMVVVQHRRTGDEIDVVLTKSKGGPSVDNTWLIRLWAREELYRTTVQAMKLLFKGMTRFQVKKRPKFNIQTDVTKSFSSGTPVIDGARGGINSHAMSLAVRAVMEDGGLITVTDVGNMTRKENPIIPTGESAIKLVLKYLRDADELVVDHNKAVGSKVSPAAPYGEGILDPREKKNYFDKHQEPVRRMRRMIAEFYLRNLTVGEWQKSIEEVGRAVERYRAMSPKQRKKRGFSMTVEEPERAHYVIMG